MAVEIPRQCNSICVHCYSLRTQFMCVHASCLRQLLVGALGLESIPLLVRLPSCEIHYKHMHIWLHAQLYTITIHVNVVGLVESDNSLVWLLLFTEFFSFYLKLLYPLKSHDYSRTMCYYNCIVYCNCSTNCWSWIIQVQDKHISSYTVCKAMEHCASIHQSFRSWLLCVLVWFACYCHYTKYMW